MSLDLIRSWRDQTRGRYDRKSIPQDSDAVANTIGWWKDVDLLLTEVDRLRSIDVQQIAAGVLVEYGLGHEDVFHAATLIAERVEQEQDRGAL